MTEVRPRHTLVHEAEFLFRALAKREGVAADDTEEPLTAALPDDEGDDDAATPDVDPFPVMFPPLVCARLCVCLSLSFSGRIQAAFHPEFSLKNVMGHACMESSLLRHSEAPRWALVQFQAPVHTLGSTCIHTHTRARGRAVPSSTVHMSRGSSLHKTGPKSSPSTTLRPQCVQVCRCVCMCVYVRCTHMNALHPVSRLLGGQVVERCCSDPHGRLGWLGLEGGWGSVLVGSLGGDHSGGGACGGGAAGVASGRHRSLVHQQGKRRGLGGRLSLHIVVRGRTQVWGNLTQAHTQICTHVCTHMRMRMHGKMRSMICKHSTQG